MTTQEIEHRLWGNGQPGDVQRLDGRIDMAVKQIQQLQEFRWKAVGAFGAIVGFFSFISGDGVVSLKHFLGQ